MAAGDFLLVESALVAWSGANYDAARVGDLGARFLTDLPNDLEDELPVVQITRFGGPKIWPNLDRPTLDIDCYASTRVIAEDLATYVSGLYFRGLRADRDGNSCYMDYEGVRGVFSNIREIQGVGWRTYENPAVERYGFAIQLLVRSSKIPA